MKQDGRWRLMKSAAYCSKGFLRCVSTPMIHRLTPRISTMSDAMRCEACDVPLSGIAIKIPSHSGVGKASVATIVGRPRPNDDEHSIIFVITSHFRIENNVVKGKEVSYHDDHTSMGETLLRILEENPDFVGQIDAATGQRYTYGDMRERSVRCALWMQSQGLSPGDIVALCSHDHLDLPMPCFAALYLGAAFNSWDPTLNPDNFRHQMNIIKPKMVFANERSAAVVGDEAKKAKLDVKIIIFGHIPGFLDFESIIAEPSVHDVKEFVCSPTESLDQIALILFSSGATGLSKGVALSHRALKMQSRQTNGLGMVGRVCLSFSPIGWITGAYDMLWRVLFQIPRIVTPLFDERLACALIEKYKVSWVFLSPVMISRLVKSDAVGGHDLSSVSTVVCAGASLSVATQRAFAELVPNARIFLSYGLTELGGYLSMQSTESQPGSCGEIFENAQLKVIDPETGRTLKANERGELLLKSVSMMSFYCNDPQATSEAVDNDGWLHTGDLGYYDESGEIFVVDRLKDIIRLADYDVSPSEIEDAILSHPGVKEAVVVGKPHPDGDDHPIAFVVRVADRSDTGKQVTETEIVDLVAAQLPDSRKQLTAGVRFVDHIPRTMSNKIRRAALRDLAISMENSINDATM